MKLAVCCSVLQCVWVVLQCVAVCCSVLQCVAVCCSVLQCVAVCVRSRDHVLVSAMTTFSGFLSYYCSRNALQ